MTRVIAAIEAAGVEIIDDAATSAGTGRGVRLRHAGTDRRDRRDTRPADAGGAR